MVFVDTNILLRWLLNDHTKFSAEAKDIIAQAESHSLMVADIVLAEIVYILRIHGSSREEVAEVLRLIMHTPAFRFDEKWLTRKTIDFFERTSLDFTDCYLIARALEQGKDLRTFDKKMLKIYQNEKGKL